MYEVIDNDTIDVKVTPSRFASRVFITFISDEGRFSLNKKFDSIETNGKSGKIIAKINGKITEFRTPKEYNVDKKKARDFWEQLTDNGWEITEK